MRADEGPSIIRTKNWNRNMVLALLQRVPYAHDPYWADGLRRFGVSYLVGVNDKIKLNADDFPYETCPHYILNDNEPS